MLFIKELASTPSLHRYYKFLERPERFRFRKHYFCQRLAFIAGRARHGQRIWDCGCGYGTTGLFLAMNGIACHGTTVEFYLEQLNARRGFWRQHGDVSLFSASHENIFSSNAHEGSYDAIVVQDTLHHLEPLGEALSILSKSLRQGGRLLVVEENGDNLVQRAKLFLQRGNRRIIEVTDKATGEKFLLGNENIRGLASWQREMAGHGLSLEELEYLRFYPPFWCSRFASDSALARAESSITHPFLRKYAAFGINFIAKKN